MSSKPKNYLDGYHFRPFRVINDEQVPDFIATLMDKCKRRAGEHKRTLFDGGVPIEYAHEFLFLSQELEVLYNTLYPEQYKAWRDAWMPYTPPADGVTQGERCSFFLEEDIEKANAERDVTGKST